jgi:hypothetical protein
MDAIAKRAHSITPLPAVSGSPNCLRTLSLNAKRQMQSLC